MFSLAITNKDTGATIYVDSSSTYDGWRIPSDGLDGFGSMPFSITEAELAAASGGVVLGAHSGTRQLIIKLEAPPTEAKRDEAYKTFAVGSTVTIEVAYLRNDSRAINGTVTACKVSEGNIYEPTTVTATIDCVEPAFEAAASVKKTANGYTVGSGYAGYTWSGKINGDAIARLESVVLPFTTTNTATVTLTKQATVKLTITRAAASSAYDMPKQTILQWSAGPATGTSIEAKTAITWEVRFDGTVPVCSYNGTDYGMKYAKTANWQGIGSYGLWGGTSCTVSLLVGMSSNIAPQYLSTERGIMSYTPGWQGV